MQNELNPQKRTTAPSLTFWKETPTSSLRLQPDALPRIIPHVSRQANANGGHRQRLARPSEDPELLGKECYSDSNTEVFKLMASLQLNDDFLPGRLGSSPTRGERENSDEHDRMQHEDQIELSNSEFAIIIFSGGKFIVFSRPSNS